MKYDGRGEKKKKTTTRLRSKRASPSISGRGGKGCSIERELLSLLDKGRAPKKEKTSLGGKKRKELLLFGGLLARGGGKVTWVVFPMIA